MRTLAILLVSVIVTACDYMPNQPVRPRVVRVEVAEYARYVNKDFAGLSTADDATNLAFKIGGQVLSAVGRYDLTDSLGLTKCLRDNGDEATLGLINLEKALGHKADSDLLSRLLASGVCYRISHLRVGGADMKNIGLTGPKIGQALDTLLTAVIEGRVENERDALIQFLKTN